jgi:hypothetical protein
MDLSPHSGRLIRCALQVLAVFALLEAFPSILEEKMVLLAFENLKEKISWLISVPEQVRALSLAKY